ncbi:MAG: bifunctional diguanylate cyclase/phosphodiesterase [Ilumatobacter sp.]|uniref:putative bifunctional diguanylate cyclase/phosphodiesterase n=1 Tax=Ilumatobacter sp. TaxID=1967498 RepID=UPI00261C2106|nr:bifunctional diguanylate cyclase/phosphodiesterase [Ilumatobacter sp.]MDJ0771634.1 bifunctional diguanylate cyclase/phosphodiesterase [Ilumatobacter sp.]
MSRVQRAAPWLYAVVALVLLLWLAARGDVAGWVWHGSIGAVVITAGFFAWRINAMPAVFGLGLALAAARLHAIVVADSAARSDLRWSDSLPTLAVGIGFTLVLGVAVTLRHGAMGRRDALDAAAVAVGAALTAWIVIANPLIDRFDVGTGLAVVSAGYLPAAVLLTAFTIDVLVSGLTSNRAMQFVVAAATANLVAAVLTGLRQVDVVSTDWRPIASACFAAALFLTAAGMAHPSGPATITRRAVEPKERPHRRSRLLLITATFLTPITVTAGVSPTSTTDLVVRVTGTALLVAVVAVRMWIAVVDDDRARNDLLVRLNRDELTNLSTREPFVASVDDVLETTWRSERRPTIIQVNLDRFKNINDSLGHHDANRVLAEIGRRLAAVAAAHDGHAARSGGDDFLLLVGSTTSTTEAMALVDDVRSSLRRAISIGEDSIFVTASIGVAVAPSNRTLTADELIRRADIATHRAKAEGRNRLVLFDDSMQARLAHRMDVEHALHGAIERHEMRLYHQPIVDVATGDVHGFESLIRWQRPDGTLVLPNDFIAIAEETGVINDIGAWALEHALTALRGWIEDGVVNGSTTVSVNVSPHQIADPGFSDVVRNALERSGMPPHLLWIEMTESMMLDEPELAQTTLRRVRSMGVRIALDDFGTGYSSLSLLRQFPIQRIKIDREFVHGLAHSANDRSLVRTIIAMGQSMGLDLVGEGVETVHQLHSLRELGCDKAQGFLVSHPVPSDAMRSTMSALSELADLSIFTSAPKFEVVRPAETEPTAPRMTPQPIGAIGPGPLGGPQL